MTEFTGQRPAPVGASAPRPWPSMWPSTSSILGSGAIEHIECELPSVAGCRHGLALPSATMALRVGLHALGIGPGDEVVVAALDWIAARAAVCSLGATAVAVDVVLPDCTISPAAVERAISARTRAVIATHLGGVPADVAALSAVTDRHRIALVEDAAQALGARLDGRPVGSFGAFAALSFGPGKLLDAGGGGMLVTNEYWLWQEAVRLSQHPTRQLLAGIGQPNLAVLEARIHPSAAEFTAARLDAVGARVDVRHRLTEGLRRRALQAGLQPPHVGQRALCTGDSLPVIGSFTRALNTNDCGLKLVPLEGPVNIGRLAGDDPGLVPNAEQAARLVRRVLA